MSLQKSVWCSFRSNKTRTLRPFFFFKKKYCFFLIEFFQSVNNFRHLFWITSQAPNDRVFQSSKWEKSHKRIFLSVESAYRFENQKNHYDMINVIEISFQEHFLLPTTFFLMVSFSFAAALSWWTRFVGAIRIRIKYDILAEICATGRHRYCLRALGYNIHIIGVHFADNFLMISSTVYFQFVTVYNLLLVCIRRRTRGLDIRDVRDTQRNRVVDGANFSGQVLALKVSESISPWNWSCWTF